MYDKAIEFVLKHEGGYVNDPRDPGGETNYGISKRAYPDLDIKNLSVEAAKEIYFRDYYSKIPAELPYRLAAVVFDCAVNTGLSRAVRLLQLAVGVVDDGKWGDKSKAALRKITEDEVIKRFTSERIMFYARLNTFPTFGKGWIRRTVDCMATFI